MLGGEDLNGKFRVADTVGSHFWAYLFVYKHYKLIHIKNILVHQGLIKEKVMYKEQLLHRFSKTLSMVLKQLFWAFRKWAVKEQREVSKF